MTDVNYFLQFGAKQRNREIKCSRYIRNLQNRLNEWLVNLLNDTTISRCHCGETNANFSGAVFFIELRRKSLKLRLEWSLMDKFTKSIIQNCVGNLCKVNIYRLKLLVLAAKCRGVLWINDTGYLVLISVTLVCFVILRMILTNKTYRPKFKHTQTQKTVTQFIRKIHVSLEHLNKMI